MQFNKYLFLFDNANSYNKKLYKLNNQFYEYKSIKNYKNVLNIDNKGMMGYISIKKINVKLPIYHVTGYDFSTGKPVIQFDFADGTIDENGKTKPYSTLLTTHFQ